ncbi:MAG: hypothetical protein KAW41_03440 [Candidatus Diapherotrites archaeon]|nr:hypothetical protein [Candidatus Diapherotrites archaeon]
MEGNEEIKKKEKIPDDVWEIAQNRLASMPSNIRVSIGGGDPLTKDEILEHLRVKDPTGAVFARMQLNYLQQLGKLTAESA